jgi:hypothetical protein
MLKQTNLKDICLQFHTTKDVTIQYVSKILSSILNEETINENNEPNELREAYMKFLENIIIKPKRGVKFGIATNIRGMAFYRR